jgi:acetylglutamate kinase
MTSVSLHEQSEATCWITQALGFPIEPEQLAGKRLLIKVGGASLTHLQVLEDCVWLRALGASPIVLHGGGPRISAWLTRLQIPVRTQEGLRVTDAPTLEVVRMVLGKINQEMVASLSQMKLGRKVIGVSGVDAQVLSARRMDPALGLVGTIEAVSTDLLTLLLAHHYFPIIAPLAQGRGGTVLNVNADEAAACVAEALGADLLLFVSDVPGISGRNGGYLTYLERQEALQMLADGTIHDGMIPKVKAALRAAKHVPHVQIIPGAEAHSVLRACFGAQPFGTTIVPEGRSDPSTSHGALSLSVRDNHPGEAKGDEHL